MKRISKEINRWVIYLHRHERGLPLVDPTDLKQRCLEDEIFARLFDSTSVSDIPEDQLSKDGTWANGVHSTVTKDVDALQKECKGHAGKSAIATKKLLESLPQEQGGQGGSGSSSQPSGTDRDAADGLSNVGFGNAPWSGKWSGETEANKRAKTLAEKLKDNERLKKIALLAGKFKHIAITKQKAKVKRGVDEITDIVQGDDLARLLPTETVRLVSKKYKLLMLRDLLERKCLEYEMTSTESLGRGPLVLCIDKSSSMEGDKDIWATAVALALAERVHDEHRTFILLAFADNVVERMVIKPGKPLPERALLIPCSGGTDIGKVIDLSLHAVESRTVMRKADIVLVTDGQSDLSPAPWLRDRAKTKNVRIFGVGIGVPEGSLEPWADEASYVTDTSKMDAGTATLLFGT